MWQDRLGTTRVRRLLENSSAGRSLKDNAWFEGYAPCLAPQVIVVALFEHREHGQFTDPIVRDVIKSVSTKKPAS
jgi:penicillin-binding protein 2